MAEPRIPDRTQDPALQASVDHGPKATTATDSDEPNDAPPKAPPDADEPDAEEVEKMTGVPADSKELSTI